MAQGRDQFYHFLHGYFRRTTSKTLEFIRLTSYKRSCFILERSFEDDEYNEDEIVLTSFELEYEIEIQKRFRQLQKIFADKKAELAKIAQPGYQTVIG